MAPKTKVCLVLIALLITGLSVVLTGLTANNLYWYRHRFEDDRNFVDVIFYRWSNEEQRGWNHTATIEYFPGNLTINDRQALLAAGIIGTLCGATVLFMNVWERDKKLFLNLTGRRTRPFACNGPVHIITLNGLLVIVFVVIAPYTWIKYTAGLYDRRFDGYSVDLDNIVLATGTTHYRSNTPYTLETWNCALSEALLANSTSPSSADLRSQCRQGMVARIMILPLAVLAAVGLSVHFWAWRKQNIRSHEVPHNNQTGGKSNEVDDWDGRKDAMEAGSAPVMELPSASPRWPAPAGGSHVHELEGISGYQELPASSFFTELQGRKVKEKLCPTGSI